MTKVIVVRLPEDTCDDCAKQIVEEVLQEEHGLTLDEVDLSVVTVKAVNIPSAIKEMLDSMPPQFKQALGEMLKQNQESRNEG